MRDEVDRQIEGLLRAVADDPVPEPRAELVSRTLQGIRGFVLLVDLLQLMTFEALWRSVSGADDDARALEERQDQG